MDRALARGDDISFPTFLTPTYVVYTPEGVRAILVDRVEKYARDAPLQRMLEAFQQNLSSAKTGFLRRGTALDEFRRSLQPGFVRKAMAGSGEFTLATVLESLESWDTPTAAEAGIDVFTEMKALVLRVVLRVLFGIDLGGETSRAVAEDLEEMEKLVSRRKDQAGREALARHHALVGSIVDVHRSGSVPAGALSRFFAESDDDRGQLEADVSTLFVIGSDTTSVALTWTWYLLAQHPEIRDRLEREIEAVAPDRDPTVDDLGALRFARMVFMESLRLFPPAWIVSRRAVENDEISGCPIPAGSVVAVSPYAMHHSPRYWADPESFDPERFAPGAAASRPPATYIPFGAGPHRCIGESLAMMEGVLILATVARRCRFELLDGSVTPKPGWVLPPATAVMMRPRFRLPRA